MDFPAIPFDPSLVPGLLRELRSASPIRSASDAL